jgi:nicotinate-nucleotide pyrophosphorylase (carboxylating)|tara:strand:+ start:1367 stop:2191 length:825 start_codon:yes stop_codon:yes gene_type:complete
LVINVKKELLRFLAEDAHSYDITSALLPNQKINAQIISRDDGMIAGIKFAKDIFKLKRIHVKSFKTDGSKVRANQKILQISGNSRDILSCERTVLNLLSRMSGIATQTNFLVTQIKKFSKKTKLYSTRKTAPGLRYFDKEAVKIGGGYKHRLSLNDMIMIKDNHLLLSNSMEDLIKKARRKHKRVEVEVENQNDSILAAKCGATIIMLDNFSPTQIKKTIASLERKKLRGKVQLEASGGINAKNITAYAKTGVDMISVGSITNSVKGLDLSLEV